MTFDPHRARPHDEIYLPRVVQEWRQRGCRTILGGYEHASPRTLALVRAASLDGSLIAELVGKGQFDLHVELPRGLILFNEVKSTAYDRASYSVEIGSYRQMLDLQRGMGDERVLVAFFRHPDHSGDAAYIEALGLPLIIVPERLERRPTRPSPSWESSTTATVRRLRREFPGVRVETTKSRAGSGLPFVVYEHVRDVQPFPDAADRIITRRRIYAVGGLPGPCEVCALAWLSKPQHFQQRSCMHTLERRQ